MKNENEREMSGMTAEERNEAEKIFGRSIDFEVSSFYAGGSWEGGTELIDFDEIITSLSNLKGYLKSINVTWKK